MSFATKFVLSRRTFLCSGAAAVTLPCSAQSFDHQHDAWTRLLKKHVVLLDGGQATQLRYAGMASDRSALQRYLASLSVVNASTFETFTKTQQMSFLINAYNAYTVGLILTRYPKVTSIKELGSLLQSPWKKEFVPLLGKTWSLDGIEHEQLRSRGRFDDPRVHFAVNCASIGCPALREEAFVAERMDEQLDAQARRFMSDRSRNRWNAAKQQLEVSKIFDWYGEDFRLGHRGIASLAAFCARYADLLANTPADRERIRAMTVPVTFLDYDWKLNDANY